MVFAIQWEVLSPAHILVLAMPLLVIGLLVLLFRYFRRED